MNGVTRPQNIFYVTAESLEPYNRILCDRDGVLGHYGEPVHPHVARHVNGLIDDSPAHFSIVTNGSSDAEGINAEVIRTWPRIKQFPGVLKSMVTIPEESLLVTDSFSELLAARYVGINVFYLVDKFNPHPTERIFRNLTKPIKAPISNLIGINTT